MLQLVMRGLIRASPDEDGRVKPGHDERKICITYFFPNLTRGDRG
jgi:hypothetical protein